MGMSCGRERLHIKMGILDLVGRTDGISDYFVEGGM